MAEYRVQLDVFTGPLDLLLYLIKRDEIDVYDIPVARVTTQYLSYIQALEQLDPDAAGEFLVMAATLLELKSRALLPTPPLETLEDTHDPRAPLVRQLLEYKRFKDAARALGSSADDRAKRYVRKPCELPTELRGVELEEAQVWDLLAAFTKVMQSIGRGPGIHEVRYDDTPIELHGAEILAILEQEGPSTFDKLFEGQVERVYIIGRFLAILELIRNHKLRAEQENVFGHIYLFLLEEVDEAPESAAPLNGEELQNPDGRAGVASDDGEQEDPGLSDHDAELGPDDEEAFDEDGFDELDDFDAALDLDTPPSPADTHPEDRP